jgi:phospholipid/cholesterol/gamma-HCH transport system substrate-binding protein
VPLAEDGIPTLTADLSETSSIRDSLHMVDQVLVGNRQTVKDGLRRFETYTASLAGTDEAIASVIAKADGAFDSFDRVVSRIDAVVPGMASGSADELFQKLRSLRELAESFNKRSGVFIEEGRRTLLDVSQSAIKVTRKLDPQAAVGTPLPGPRKPADKRQ